MTRIVLTLFIPLEGGGRLQITRCGASCVDMDPPPQCRFFVFLYTTWLILSFTSCLPMACENYRGSLFCSYDGKTSLCSPAARCRHRDKHDEIVFFHTCCSILSISIQCQGAIDGCNSRFNISKYRSIIVQWFIAERVNLHRLILGTRASPRRLYLRPCLLFI